MFGFLGSGKLQAQHEKDAEEIARLRNQLATVESQNSSLQSDNETLRATLSARDEKCDWLSNIFDRVAGVQELLGGLQSSSYNLSVTMRNESALFQESSMTAGLGGTATIKFVDGVRAMSEDATAIATNMQQLGEQAANIDGILGVIK